MCFVYILLSKQDNKYYIGSTNNLDRRINEHNNGKCISTKNRLPVKIVYIEELPNIKLARKREYTIKSYKGGNAFKSLFKM
jgi:putative endonuclease